MRVLIAAGGTGGHIIPAIAVAQALKKDYPDAEVTFVGVGKDLERKLVGEAGFPLESLPSVPVSGGGINGVLRFLRLLPSGLFAARQLNDRICPQVVIGFGGYPAFLPMLEAFLRRIPRVLHEQNAKVGIANKLLSLIASKIFAVHGAVDFWGFKAIEHINNPVRQKFLDVSVWQASVAGEQFRILIVGGSQGAVSLNAAVLECVDIFTKLNVFVTHQTGAKDFEHVQSEYEKRNFSAVEVVPFIDDMAAMYEAAQLVICRAGAMTVAEVCAAGRPAIFVPLVIAGGHQSDNCRALVKKNGALMLPQDVNLVPKLRETIEHLVSHPKTLKTIADKARAEYLQDGKPSAEIIAAAAVDLIK